MMGKPVVGGTRITVELVIEKLAAGESVDQILPGEIVVDESVDKQPVDRLRAGRP